MKDILFVVTVPHTGTRSLMNVIDKDGYIKLAKFLYYNKKKRKPEHRTKVYYSDYEDRRHIYLPDFVYYWEGSNRPNSLKGCELIRQDATNIIHGHVDENSIDTIKFLSNYADIITTCRDPLLSLLSAKQKNKNQIRSNTANLETSLRIDRLFKSWKLWAEYIYPNAFTIPVDIKKEDLIYKGYDFSIIHKVKVTYNKKGYPEKYAYESSNLEFIKQQLGEDYDTLCDMKSLLKPILEEIGYEGLLWW